MADLYTNWRQGNKTKYLETTVVAATTGSTTDFSVDLFNRLDSGDSLITATVTSTSSGITFNYVTVYADLIAGRTAPHQIVGFLTVSEVGTHDVKLTTTTANGRKFVYHFDVFARQ